MASGRKTLKEEIQVVRYMKELSGPVFAFIKECLEKQPTSESTPLDIREIRADKKWANEQMMKLYVKAIPQEITGDGPDGGIIFKVISYAGDNNSIQLDARKAPIADTPEPSQIQDNSLAQKSAQDNTGDKPTDKGSVEGQGDVLVHSPILQPSEENSLAGTGNAPEVLPANNLGETK